MSDLISRQAAITVMANAMHSLPLSKPHSWRWLRALAESALSHLESVQPDKEVEYWHELCNSYELTIVKLSAVIAEQLGTQWIPVSERLPEDEYVLISKKPTKLSGDKWCVGIGIRTADPRSRKIQWRDSGFGVIQDDKVLAWMPLPKPYIEG